MDHQSLFFASSITLLLLTYHPNPSLWQPPSFFFETSFFRFHT